MATVADPPGTRAPTLATPLLYLIAALLGFTLLKEGTDLVAATRPGLAFAWAAAIAALASAFAWVTPGQLPPFARRALRAAALFLGAYFLIEPFAIPYAAMPAGHPAVVLHQHGRWIGLALALLGWWRPSALFAAAMLLWMMRELHTGLTGFYFSTLDIRNVAEVIAFWSIGFALVAAGWRLGPVRRATGLDPVAVQTATIMILAAGIGAHLANYLYSGLAKLALDGGFLSWLLGNRLSDGIPAAIEKGTLPIAFWPWGVEQLDAALRLVGVPVNLLSFLAQIAVVAAVFRRRWLIVATLALDAFHILVWATLGLFFWKWIALNAIIVATLAAVREDEWNRVARWTAFAFVVAGVGLFRVATLAWYETPGFASPYFVATMDDGRRYRIPNAAFLSSSYQVSQGRLWWPGGAGHFNPSIWGSVLRHEDAVAGRTCTPPRRTAPAEPAWGPPRALAGFVRAYHRQTLGRLDGDGHLGYYRVPHHHVPSPFVADPYWQLDKRRVAAYSLVVDSVCLSLDHGRLARRVIARDVLPLYDARADRLL